jgi:transposase
MVEKYIVNLNAEERQHLLSLTNKGKISGRMLKRVQILVLADEGHPDETIAQMLHVGESTVHRTRQRCVEQGVELALKERPRIGGKRKLDGKAEAFLVATACSDPPSGKAKWTMQLLAERLVELQLVESISDETVRRCLEKTTSSRG